MWKPEGSQKWYSGSVALVGPHLLAHSFSCDQSVVRVELPLVYSSDENRDMHYSCSWAYKIIVTSLYVVGLGNLEVCGFMVHNHV